jgi:hypothetical protein
MADSSLLVAVRQAIHDDSSRFAAEVEGICLDSSSGSLLVLRRHSPLSSGSFVAWSTDLLAAFKSQHPGQDVREDWISINGFPALQIHATDSLRVYFSLIFERSPPRQLDYSVPLAVWEAQVRAVESSLGSIRFVK